jgi:hypothetical protein
MNITEINEANKIQPREGLDKEIIDFIKDELKKSKLNRKDIYFKIKKNFKNEKGIDTLSKTIISKIMSLKLNKAEYKSGKSYLNYFWLGKDAKEPTDAKLVNIKKFKNFKNDDKKDDIKKPSKIDKFAEFDEKEAQKAKGVAQEDMKKDKRGDLTDRQIDFNKDSTTQLYIKRKSVVYKKYWDDINDEIESRQK